MALEERIRLRCWSGCSPSQRLACAGRPAAAEVNEVTSCSPSTQIAWEKGRVLVSQATIAESVNVESLGHAYGGVV
jgi:hypothetical protein